MTDLITTIQKRRSQYAISGQSQVSNEKVAEVVTQVNREVPTAYNSQTNRVVLVFGQANEKVWQHIADVQRSVLGEEGWQMMGGIIEGAKNAQGTALFFADIEAVKNWIPATEERQEVFKQHNSANAQYATWLALTDLGLGATLQHFNIGHDQGHDKGIREILDLPDSYELVAQMPFGAIEEPAGEKEYIDSETLVQVYK